MIDRKSLSRRKTKTALNERLLIEVTNWK